MRRRGPGAGRDRVGLGEGASDDGEVGAADEALHEQPAAGEAQQRRHLPATRVRLG